MSNEELSITADSAELDTIPNFMISYSNQSEYESALSEHRMWLKNIRHEIPNPKRHFRVAIYIRYFNQTKYDNYIEFHVKQYKDTMSLCPMWELVDFYIDQGATAPNMESAPEWNRLLQDCLDGKVDLIITQKVSNVSKKPYEISYCARILAAMNPPIGIYFVSENIFTLASYYSHDLKDTEFFPSPDWQLLPDETSKNTILISAEDEENDR